MILVFGGKYQGKTEFARELDREPETGLDPVPDFSEEIRKVTRELLAAFPRGGLIAAPTHDIPGDAIPENVIAMWEVFEEQKKRAL